ncbi:hypothetical protein AHF37_12428 [Paragonimus kellicotti]|nr:hypothetical protein AHF37_12428 [Paragonimus kellicotti]
MSNSRCFYQLQTTLTAAEHSLSTLCGQMAIFLGFRMTAKSLKVVRLVGYQRH